MIDKDMKKIELQRNAKISGNVLAKLGKNEFVSMESLVRICEALKCNIGDIVDVTLDN